MIPPPNNSGNNNFLPQVPAAQKIAPPRVDFDQDRFDVLVGQKGVDVLVERALQCPCKTKSINQLPSCKNCGGTGWIFVNPRKSRFVLQSMNFQNKEEVWSRLVHGIIKVTAPAEEELAFMDRITRLDANSLFSEIVEFEEWNNEIYGFLTYTPKRIDYIGIYVDAEDPLTNYSLADIKIIGNRIVLNNTSDLPQFDNSKPLTATILYVHAPTFNIIEHQREAFDNKKWNGVGETLQYLPVLALARRTQDLEDMNKLRQGSLNDNSYDDKSCRSGNAYKPTCNNF